MKNTAGVVIAALSLAGCATQQRDITPALRGSWGGQHIGLTLKDSDADVEFDCAEGTIFGPYSLKADGSFAWAGEFKRGMGGPVRVDKYEIQEEPPPVRATYSGAVRGREMTLTVTLEDGTIIGPFALERFKEPTIFRCL